MKDSFSHFLFIFSCRRVSISVLSLKTRSGSYESFFCSQFSLLLQESGNFAVVYKYTQICQSVSKTSRKIFFSLFRSALNLRRLAFFIQCGFLENTHVEKLMKALIARNCL